MKSRKTIKTHPSEKSVAHLLDDYGPFEDRRNPIVLQIITDLYGAIRCEVVYYAFLEIIIPDWTVFDVCGENEVMCTCMEEGNPSAGVNQEQTIYD